MTDLNQDAETRGKTYLMNGDTLPTEGLLDPSLYSISGRLLYEDDGYVSASAFLVGRHLDKVPFFGWLLRALFPWERRCNLAHSIMKYTEDEKDRLRNHPILAINVKTFRLFGLSCSQVMDLKYYAEWNNDLGPDGNLRDKPWNHQGEKPYERPRINTDLREDWAKP